MHNSLIFFLVCLHAISQIQQSTQLVNPRQSSDFHGRNGSGQDFKFWRFPAFEDGKFRGFQVCMQGSRVLDCQGSRVRSSYPLHCLGSLATAICCFDGQVFYCGRNQPKTKRAQLVPNWGQLGWDPLWTTIAPVAKKRAACGVPTTLPLPAPKTKSRDRGSETSSGNEGTAYFSKQVDQPRTCQPAESIP